MRIALIGPPGVAVSRVGGETNTVLERLIDRLQKAGHEVLLSTSGPIPFDLCVTLACDPDGNVTAATVSHEKVTMLLQAG